MEFVDYKCIESLLIDDIEIVTEGFNDTFNNIIKGAFGLLAKAFKTIAGIFKLISNKLMGKKPIKVEPANDTSSVNTKTNTTNNINTMTVIEEPKKEKEIDHSVIIDKSYTKVMQLFDKGDKVTKAFDPIMDMCAWICTCYVESEEYHEGVWGLENQSEVLKDLFNDFLNEVEDFKIHFKTTQFELNVTKRNRLCKLANKRSVECNKLASKCDNKLKDLFNVSDSEKHWFEETKTDIQKLRAPAQKALTMMSKYASDCVRMYNEVNEILATTVIITDK